MAKRSNPFVDDFIPQSKVHVGLKQFNNNEDRLKDVYEKTLALLFKGAKKAPAVDALNNNDVHFGKKEDKMKQLFIGKDGSLLHAGSMEPSAVMKQCNCGGAVESQCAYCDTVLCSACQHGCTHCLLPYCLRCVLVGFLYYIHGKHRCCCWCERATYKLKQTNFKNGLKVLKYVYLVIVRKATLNRNKIVKI